MAEEQDENQDPSLDDAPAADAGGAQGSDPEGDGEDEGGGGGKKLILFIVLPILILAGVGAGLYFSGMLDSLLGGQEEVAEEEKGEEKAEEDGEPKEPGKAAFLEIPTMIVNLSGEDGSSRFLRLTVQLELQSEEDKAAIEAVIPRVIDQFQTYLRELRVRDLRGSAGIYRLQMELLWRVNQAAEPVEVKDVLFQEILIQ